MKNKRLKRTAAAALTCGMLAGASIMAFAADVEQSANRAAGSTYITLTNGMDGRVYYAAVTADRDVDARMSGTVFYYDPVNEAIQNSSYIGDFSQKTYGEVSGRKAGDIYRLDTLFDVSSEDGSDQHLIVTQGD